MYHVALRFLENEAEAEDAVQEGFIKAFKNLHGFSNDVSFGAWLKKIVIRVCLDQLKKATNKIKPLDIENIELKEDTEEDWNSFLAFAAEKIVNCISNLPDSYKEVVHLYLIEGYDHEEISEILNISEVNSRTLLYRGKQKLKCQLNSIKNEISR